MLQVETDKENQAMSNSKEGDKILEMKSQMEKEHKMALNDMAKQRDLAKIELQQQNEEIDQLRQKLSENAEMISKQMAKISELEGRGGAPRGNRVSY